MKLAYQKGSMRLDKAIAAQTRFSRKDVHKMLSRGQILVNGQPVRNFDSRVDLEHDEVLVDGQPLALTRHSYLMLHKPRGVVCATADAALPTVLDLVPEELRRSGLAPAGRLDKDTTGFVLLTNDGDFSHRILSPRSHVPKTYLALLDRPPDHLVVEAFAAGVALSPDKHDNLGPGGGAARQEKERTICLPARLEPVEGAPCAARVVIRQGMYHQVKRMFAAFGIMVTGLHREKIGGLSLDPSLPEGGCRPLSVEEIAQIETECQAEIF